MVVVVIYCPEQVELVYAARPDAPPVPAHLAVGAPARVDDLGADVFGAGQAVGVGVPADLALAEDARHAQGTEAFGIVARTRRGDVVEADTDAPAANLERTSLLSEVKDLIHCCQDLIWQALSSSRRPTFVSLWQTPSADAALPGLAEPVEVAPGTEVASIVPDDVGGGAVAGAKGVGATTLS